MFCVRCSKDLRKDGEDGTRLITGEFIHDQCRTSEEYLEQMLGMKLENATEAEVELCLRRKMDAI